MSSSKQSSPTHDVQSTQPSQGHRGQGAQTHTQGKGGGAPPPKRQPDRAPSGTKGPQSETRSPPSKQQQNERGESRLQRRQLSSSAHGGEQQQRMLAQPNFSQPTTESMRMALEQPAAAYSPHHSPGHYSTESHQSVRPRMLAHPQAKADSMRSTSSFMHSPAFRLACCMIA